MPLIWRALPLAIFRLTDATPVMTWTSFDVRLAVDICDMFDGAHNVRWIALAMRTLPMELTTLGCLSTYDEGRLWSCDWDKPLASRAGYEKALTGVLQAAYGCLKVAG